MTTPAAAIARRQVREKHFAERLRAQAGFVRDLATLHPAEGALWPALAEAAERGFAAAVEAGRPVDAALAEAEAVLAPAAATARSYRVHCVGHAHLDINWQWPWQETVGTMLDTTRTVLRLMREYPGFRFSQSQGVLYEVLRHHDPDLFAEVAARIREGRWEVTASHWVEGERNTAGGEAVARQLLTTRAWMQEHLGLMPDDVPVDWVPDCFGHAASIPAIDARAGVKYYYLQRSGGNDRPPAFWWQTADGSRVLVLRELADYMNLCGPDQIKAVTTFARATGARTWMMVYGVGDHGGGPTRRHIERILDMDAWPVWPRWEFSTARTFFTELEKLGDRLPTWDRELNFELTGCLISQSAVKRANRQGENALADADGAGALAFAACGVQPPRARLATAWRDALLTHFHDILPGSNTADSKAYTVGMTQRVLAEAQSVQSTALRALAQVVDTSWAGQPSPSASTAGRNPVPNLARLNLGAGAGFVVGNASAAQAVDGWPLAIVVANPSAWDRQEVITVRAWEGNIDRAQPVPPPHAFAVRDAQGTMVRAQVLGTGRWWAHSWTDLAVPARVAAGGWTAYALVVDPAAPAVAKAAAGPGTVGTVCDHEGQLESQGKIASPFGRLGFENEHLTVRFDTVRGGIGSLVERSSGREFVPAGACLGLPVVTIERPAPASSWVIHDTRDIVALGCDKIEILQHGPYLAVIQAVFRHRDSRITLTWTLAGGENRLRLKVETRWLERGSAELGTPRLSLRFPLGLSDDGSSPLATAEIPFGSLERPSGCSWGSAGGALRGQAAPGQTRTWDGEADPSGAAGTPHSGEVLRKREPKGRTLPTLRRVAVRGRDAGAVLANDGISNYALETDALVVHLLRATWDPDPLPEIGDHAWNFLFQVGTKLAPELPHRLGVEANHALRWAVTDAHAGRLAGTSPTVTACTPAHVAVTQLKPAEDGDGVIIRVQELIGTAATARVHLDAAAWGAIAAAVPVDLLERPLAGATAAIDGEGFTFAIGAWAIVSVRVRLRR